MTIYDIAGVVGTAFHRAMTPANILSGFRVSGISPFDRLIFNEDDFLPSAVTDMPNPHQPPTTTVAAVHQPPTTTVAAVHQPPITTVAAVHQPPTTTVAAVHQPPTTTVATVHQPPITTVAAVHQPPEARIAVTVTQAVDATVDVLNSLPSTSRAGGSVSSTSIAISPEHVRPFPKACPRKGIRRGRKPGRTRVLTDTPEKNAIIQEQQKKSCKRKGGAKTSSVARALVVSKKAKPAPVNDDDSCPCLLCGEPFSNSQPGEKWVQCTTCKMWAHENCTSGDKCFVCDHCQ